MSNAALALTAVMLLTLAPMTSRAQEHPEHPKSGAGQQPKQEGKAAAEQPKKAAVREYTVEDMGKAIDDYIRVDSTLKGGFLLVDPKTSKVLQLKLVKIHKDKLAEVGEGLYFACSDFQATDGNTYDLDFFMKEGTDQLEVSEIAVHKVNGKPRYNWQEKDGLWTKVSID